ncbi:rNA polymerase sigma factor [Clostridium sp. CAG:609]|nr:rNA polymerase sigma factor [Clostridium sp. CAG:609]
MIERLINECVPLVWKISKQFYGVDKNDLYQAGILGIIKAYQNYKNDGTTKFSTYAYNYIFGEMYLVSCNKEIKLNKDINKLIKMVEVGKNRLSQEILREPTLKELSNFLEIPMEKLEQVMQISKSFVRIDEEKDDERSLHEMIKADEDISIDDKIMINDGINTLDNLEQAIIKNRYFLDLTQSETAKLLGITQVMVSRYEQKSLKKLRQYMYM